MSNRHTEPRVVLDPEILSGVPVFAGTRVPVDVVLGSLQSGDSWDEVKESYSFLTPAHLLVAIAHVRKHGWTPPAPSLSSQFGPPIWISNVQIPASAFSATSAPEAARPASAEPDAESEQLIQALKELKELMPRH